jgi:chromosome segregation ATPase
MNAIIREVYEAPVLTNETIEVHLAYLRSSFDAAHAALPVLRDKIDLLSAKVDSQIEKMDAKIETLSEKTNTRIDAVDASLSAKIEATNARIDAVNTSLSAKIDKANEQRAGGDAVLVGKIDKLTEKVLEDRGQLKAIVWLLGVSSVFASLASIARTLNWI